MGNRVMIMSDYRGAPALRAAVDEFFWDKNKLSDNTLRTYRAALDGLGGELGWEVRLNALYPESVAGVFWKKWGHLKPLSWNSRMIPVRSFISWCQRRDWLEHDPLALVERRRVPADRTRVIGEDQLGELWARRDIRLREKTLWRFLYETSARVRGVLPLNVEDLNRKRRSAVVLERGGGKGTIY